MHTWRGFICTPLGRDTESPFVIWLKIKEGEHLSLSWAIRFWKPALKVLIPEVLSTPPKPLYTRGTRYILREGKLSASDKYQQGGRCDAHRPQTPPRQPGKHPGPSAFPPTPRALAEPRHRATKCPGRTEPPATISPVLIKAMPPEFALKSQSKQADKARWARTAPLFPDPLSSCHGGGGRRGEERPPGPESLRPSGGGLCSGRRPLYPRARWLCGGQEGTTELLSRPPPPQPSRRRRGSHPRLRPPLGARAPRPSPPPARGAGRWGEGRGGGVRARARQGACARGRRLAGGARRWRERAGGSSVCPLWRRGGRGVRRPGALRRGPRRYGFRLRSGGARWGAACREGGPAPERRRPPAGRAGGQPEGLRWREWGVREGAGCWGWVSWWREG